ncbi:NRDE family protein [Crocinitomix algicola]|uniref:NRDE family protein n=1 Tax=Crocinitomix algicola TaxID=1740263 RepID=UPI0008347C06|nr:NRDE family protein [Crocinitomix algicola]
MCTATYLKDKKGRVIFTTNRDENVSRPTSPPAIHNIEGQRLLFPQDQLAGGTWVAIAETGQISCVLNGAPDEVSWLGTTAKYSRGQVLLDSFKRENIQQFYQDDSIMNAHPFTLLIIPKNADKISIVRWNGKEKWIDEADANQPEIWSAHTLYPKDQRERRARIFHDWSNELHERTPNAVWQMHQSSENQNGLLLENSQHVNTVSTTQIVLGQSHCTMSYFQMDEDLKTVEAMSI